jgi:hypothetical protein
VAELAAREVTVDVLAGELEARGQAFEHGHETGAVRLASRRQAQRRHAQNVTCRISGKPPGSVGQPVISG